MGTVAAVARANSRAVPAPKTRSAPETFAIRSLHPKKVWDQPRMRMGHFFALPKDPRIRADRLQVPPARRFRPGREFVSLFGGAVAWPVAAHRAADDGLAVSVAPRALPPLPLPRAPQVGL
jgi:hypothetical protein